MIGIEKIKSSYKIKCNNRNYCLKVIKYDFRHFSFILGAVKHLIDKGFQEIPKIIITKTGKEYINILGNFAYLMEWVNARECNYDNPIDIVTATRKLAELHLKSYNFTITDMMKPRVGWLKWIENFNIRIDEIKDFKNRIENKGKLTTFDELYLDVMESEIQRGQKSIEDIKKSDYDKKMKSEMEHNSFCHHDYAHHNVLIGSDERVFVIDFDYCILDSHLHDLASLLIRCMKNGKWEMNTAKYILEAYGEINEIERGDIPIIAAFIEFPQGYWQTGIQYYWENQPWGEEFFNKRLQKILEDRQERQEFIENLKEYKF